MKEFKSGDTLTARDLNEIVSEVNSKVNPQAGTNLINPAELETGKAISANGNISGGLSATYAITGYIPVNGENIIASAYYASGTWSAGNVYDADKNFIRTLGATQQYTYQSGDAYVRFSVKNDGTARANYGTTLLAYEEYNPIGGYIPNLSPALGLVDTVNGVKVEVTKDANASTGFNFSIKDDRFIGARLFFKVTTESDALNGKVFRIYAVINGSYSEKGRATANGAPVELEIPSNASSSLLIQSLDKDWTTSVSAKFEATIKGITTKLDEALNLVDNISLVDTILGCYNKKNIIHVGKGYDFEEIQPAINSIIDASEYNQYLLLVHDDYNITSVNQLWKLSDPMQHAEADNITYSSVYVKGKNWVNIMGASRVITISVKLPSADSTSKQYDNCNVLYANGNMKMANIRFEVENTRYAYHEENGSGSINGSNANTRKYYKNCEFIYLGGARYNTAAGIGTAPGAYNTYENCTFYSAVNNGTNMMHSHPNYMYPFTYEFINCKISSLDGKTGGGYQDIGSGVTQNFILQGCEFGAFNLDDSHTGLGDVGENSAARDVRCGGVILSGHANVGYLGIYTLVCLRLETNDNNKSINIIDDRATNSNSAYALLFGEAVKNYAGTVDAKGVYVGSQRIASDKTYSTSLAKRLGDCSSANKTLRISIDSVEQVITLNKDYNNMTTDEVVSDINTLLTGCTIVRNYQLRRLTFSDTAVYVKNTGDTTLNIDNAVTLTGYNSVAKTNSGNKLYGVAAERINPNEMGLVIIKGGQYLMKGTAELGKYYKAGDNGTLVESDTDGELYCIGNRLLRWV